MWTYVATNGKEQDIAGKWRVNVTLDHNGVASGRLLKFHTYPAQDEIDAVVTTLLVRLNVQEYAQEVIEAAARAQRRRGVPNA